MVDILFFLPAPISLFGSKRSNISVLCSVNGLKLSASIVISCFFEYFGNKIRLVTETGSYNLLATSLDERILYSFFFVLF